MTNLPLNAKDFEDGVHHVALKNNVISDSQWIAIDKPPFLSTFPTNDGWLIGHFNYIDGSGGGGNQHIIGFSHYRVIQVLNGVITTLHESPDMPSELWVPVEECTNHCKDGYYKEWINGIAEKRCPLHG